MWCQHDEVTHSTRNVLANWTTFCHRNHWHSLRATKLSNPLVRLMVSHNYTFCPSVKHKTDTPPSCAHKEHATTCQPRPPTRLQTWCTRQPRSPLRCWQLRAKSCSAVCKRETKSPTILSTCATSFSMASFVETRIALVMIPSFASSIVCQPLFPRKLESETLKPVDCVHQKCKSFCVWRDWRYCATENCTLQQRPLTNQYEVYPNSEQCVFLQSARKRLEFICRFRPYPSFPWNWEPHGRIPLIHSNCQKMVQHVTWQERELYNQQLPTQTRIINCDDGKNTEIQTSNTFTETQNPKRCTTNAQPAQHQTDKRATHQRYKSTRRVSPMSRWHISRNVMWRLHTHWKQYRTMCVWCDNNTWTSRKCLLCIWWQDKQKERNGTTTNKKKNTSTQRHTEKENNRATANEKKPTERRQTPRNQNRNDKKKEPDGVTTKNKKNLKTPWQKNPNDKQKDPKCATSQNFITNRHHGHHRPFNTIPQRISPTEPTRHSSSLLERTPANSASLLDQSQTIGHDGPSCGCKAYTSNRSMNPLATRMRNTPRSFLRLFQNFQVEIPRMLLNLRFLRIQDDTEMVRIIFQSFCEKTSIPKLSLANLVRKNSHSSRFLRNQQFHNCQINSLYVVSFVLSTTAFVVCCFGNSQNLPSDFDLSLSACQTFSEKWCSC